MAGLSLFLVLALVSGGLLTWSLLSDDTYVAPAPAPSAPGSARAAAGLATRSLTALEQAVDERDVAAARALAPDGDRRAADRLAAVVQNARALRVTDFSLRYVDAGDLVGADGSWSAAVDLTWRFAGFDRHAAHAEVTVGFRDLGDRVAVTGVGGGGHVSPLWLAGPVQVRRTADTLVVVDGTAAEADRYAARARTAVRVVRRVVTDWRGGLVVEVPRSLPALDRTLDADAGTYDQIAAVTTSPDASTAATAPVHVFVNPAVFTDLRATGAQVVMSHEATHVATGAFTSTVPLWLLEGFADYVALRDVGLPVRRAASQVIAEVRRDGPPRALPDAAQFGTRTPDLGATYESAWLACRVVATDAGEAGLVRFYQAADRGTPIAAALRSTTGLTVAGLTGQWRRLLATLALSSSTG